MMNMAEIQTFTPSRIAWPRLMTLRATTWGHIPMIIADIIDRFGVPTQSALEFGTGYGYSTSALANYFEEVTGVDTFLGDLHSGYKDDHHAMTSDDLSPWPNISLVQSSFQEYICVSDRRHGLIHIDIEHTYRDTYDCGEWSVGRSDVVIFHDTETFPEVRRACSDLADRHSLEFHNYPHCCGLGILVRR